MMSPTPWLLVLVLLSVLGFDCDEGTLDTNCLITHDRVFSGKQSITGNGTISFINCAIITTIDCYGRSATPDITNCLFLINTSNSVFLNNATFRGPSIRIEAASVFMDSLSLISSDGMGRKVATDADGIAGKGGANGGDGGSGCSSNPTKGQGVPGEVIPNRVGGGSGSRHGGGLVYIQLKWLEINGTIASNGEDGVDQGPGQGGGAAGGSIAILCENDISGEGGLLSATGGFGTSYGGGGGGGRIYIAARHSIGVKVVAFGRGVLNPICDTPPSPFATLVGGAGTIIYKEGDSARVECSNELVASYSVLGLTQLPNNVSAVSLVLNNCNLKVSALLDVPNSIDLTSTSQIASSAQESTTDSLEVRSKRINVAGSSRLSAAILKVYAGTVLTVDSDSSLDFLTRCLIGASQAEIWNKVVERTSSSQTKSELRITAGSLWLTEKAELRAYSIVIDATRQLLTEGNVVSAYSLQGANCSDPRKLDCSLPVSGQAAQPFIWLHSPDLRLLRSRVEGSTLVLCGANLTTDGGSITSFGWGCRREEGIGAGKTYSGFPGGGAGHGSVGGKGRNKEGTSAGGIAYDKLPQPSCGGSGGGGLTYGGNAGGVIMLNATTRLILDSVEIVARGKDGVSDLAAGRTGGGGGSGGSIVIATATLISDSETILDVRGGNGGIPGGGGASGGIVHITWRNSLPITTNITEQLPQVFLTGGGGGGHGDSSDVEGEDGHLGVASSSPSCPPARGGLFCIGCAPGRFKGWTGNNDCSVCPAGSIAPDSMATSCMFCDAGEYSNVTRTACDPCSAGRVSSGNSSTCSACTPGRASNHDSSNCTKCPINTFSGNESAACTPCEAGTESTPGSAKCRACGPIPTHARFLSGCTMDCDKGYVLPYCKTPFQSMIDNVGGVFGFVGIVIGILIATVGPVLVCWVRHRHAQKARDVADWEEIQGLRTTQRKGGKRRRRSSAAAYQPLTTPTDTQQAPLPPLEDWTLDEGDLQHHLHRIYMWGSNSAAQPWALCELPEPQIVSLVRTGDFIHYARQVVKAAIWDTWEETASKVIGWIYPPLQPIFLAHRRRKHLNNVWAYHLNYDYAFLRNPQARALTDSLKLGVSHCKTLCWIDVLCSQQEDTFGFTLGKPALPCVLVCSGTGDFFTPFHLDPTDWLVKCLSAYFGPNWFKFIAALNTHLRTIPASALYTPTKMVPRALQDLMKYVDMMNRMGIGIGQLMPLKGVQVRLGLISQVASTDADGHSALRAAARAHGNEKGPQYNSEIRRLCLIISSSDSPIRSPREKREGSVSLVNLSPGSYQLDAGLPHSQSDIGDLDLGPAIAIQPSDSLPQMMKFGKRPRDKDRDKVNDHSPIIPYGATYLEDALAKNAKALHVSRLSRLIHFFLFNVQRRKSFLMVGWLCFGLIMAQIAAAFIEAATFGQLLPGPYAAMVLLPPLVTYAAPIVGLLALSIQHVLLMRCFAALNALCLISDFITIIVGLVSQASYLLGWQEGVLVPFLAFALRLLLVPASNLFIAHLEYARDIQLARKEYLKNKLSREPSAVKHPKGTNPIPITHGSIQQNPDDYSLISPSVATTTSGSQRGGGLFFFGFSDRRNS